MNGVVTDLSSTAQVRFAVVWQGQLLPIRFTRERDAADHLHSLETGAVVALVRSPAAEPRGAA